MSTRAVRPNGFRWSCRTSASFCPPRACRAKLLLDGRCEDGAPGRAWVASTRFLASGDRSRAKFSIRPFASTWCLGTADHSSADFTGPESRFMNVASPHRLRRFQGLQTTQSNPRASSTRRSEAVVRPGTPGASSRRASSASDPSTESRRMGVSVVTGANRGMGLALVTQLHRRGASVAAVCRQTAPEL